MLGERDRDGLERREERDEDVRSVQGHREGVRREDFIPGEIWVPHDGGFFLVPLRREDDPARWLELARRDDGVTTQVDDGIDVHGGKGVVPTSSSSAPWVMARMLDLLDVGDGMDVLEIGAGTGYNAALLAERAGSGRVTTMEIDPAVAEHARAALARAGLPVEVVTGDGELGCPGAAPFDRVIATASVWTVPYSWVRQTRPAGRIVLPYAGTFSAALLALSVGEDGTASGRFQREAGFMRLRGQRPGRRLWWMGEDDAEVRSTDRYLDAPFRDSAAGFAVGTWLTHCVIGQIDEGGPARTLLLSHAGSVSWASLTAGASTHEVTQYGPRRLWDEVEAAYDWWRSAGRPDSTRFGLTVTQDGQRFWLDSPDNPVPVP
jgi:protein-L-isoaspartate O-methyltransferase